MIKQISIQTKNVPFDQCGQWKTSLEKSMIIRLSMPVFNGLTDGSGPFQSFHSLWDSMSQLGLTASTLTTLFCNLEK